MSQRLLLVPERRFFDDFACSSISLGRWDCSSQVKPRVGRRCGAVGGDESWALMDWMMARMGWCRSRSWSAV